MAVSNVKPARMSKARSRKHPSILNRQRATNRKSSASVDMWVC
ncbi:hypothetical protein Q5689_10645 [Microcoleus sp. ARI1-A2]